MLGTTAIYKPNNWLLLILREKPNTEASYYGLLPTKFFGYTFQEIDGRFLLFIVMDDGYESNHIFFQEMKPEEQRKAKLLLNSCVINPSQFNCTFMRIGKWVAIKSPLMDPGRLRIIWVPDLGITITLADTEIKYLEAIRLEAR